MVRPAEFRAEREEIVKHPLAGPRLPVFGLFVDETAQPSGELGLVGATSVVFLGTKAVQDPSVGFFLAQYRRQAFSAQEAAQIFAAPLVLGLRQELVHQLTHPAGWVVGIVDTLIVQVILFWCHREGSLNTSGTYDSDRQCDPISYLRFAEFVDQETVMGGPLGSQILRAAA